MNRKIKTGLWKKMLEKACAYLLVLAMVTSMMIPGFATVTWAATELPVEDLPNEGASEATLYKWNTGAGTFDLQGLKTSSTRHPNGIDTTFSNKGYIIAISTDQSSGVSGGVSVKPSSNGGVQTITEKGMNVEVKVTVTPSKDNKYLLVDYYVYDKSGGNQTLYLGTGTDIKIAGDDSAKCYKTSRGFHMVNGSTKEVFDCITNDASLGITPVDTRYVGPYSPAQGSDIFKNDNTASDWTGDSGIAYSWKINLRPYETAHRRVAFAVRASSYYVSNSGSDSGEGTYTDPFLTIDKAMEKIGSGKGYIYLMDNMTFNKTYTVSNGADLTFASTDFDRGGNPVTGSGGYIKKVSRGTSFTSAPLFQVGSGMIRFTDLVVDGAGVSSSAPLVVATGGGVEINSGAVLQNNKHISDTQGGAVDLTGNSSFAMNYGTVKNITSGKKGAIHFNGGNTFELRNKITMTGNVNAENKPANVHLGTGKYITVQSDLEDSLIGITTEQTPSASVEGIINNANQEVKVAVPGTGLPSGASGSTFIDNFTSDVTEAGGKGLQITTGIGNGSNVVMRKLGYTMSYVYKDVDTGGTVTGAPVTPDSYYAVGDTVTVAPPGKIAGYSLKRVVIEQGSTNTLTATTAAGADFGKVTGTMPARDAVITYEYQRQEGSISFVVNGGTPQPEPLTGNTGSPVNAIIPEVSRYGYTFKGWSTVNDRNSPSIITGLPSTFPAEPVTYYAIFEPNSSVKFKYTVDYTNKSGSLIFQTGTTQHAAEDILGSGPKNIKGYKWSKADSVITPATFDFDGTGAVPTGSFDNTGNFTGKMPNQDMALKYIYQVDRSNDSAKSILRVKHVSKSGALLSQQETGYFPEDAITASPISKYGYQLENASITAGKTANTTGNDLTSAVTGSFNSSSTFNGTMPNQLVEITYVYKPTGEGYPFTVTYRDNDALDDSLKKIDELLQNKTAESAVTANSKAYYGYVLASKSATPAGSGSFDAGNTFTGTMPADSLSVIYVYNRDASLWKNLTYKAGANGSLNRENGVTADVKDSGSGTYKASVLINDQSLAGQSESYTLSHIMEKKLTPNPVGNKYYRFAGWFVDVNQDGILNGSESLLPDHHRFTAEETLTACFEKDPEQWYDIQFVAGSRGSIDSGQPTTMSLEFDRKWGSFALPSVTPEVNYLFDKWYDGEVAMKDGDSLQRGHTYTARFYPDPDIFGTDVAQPDALGMLNDDGKGRVAVYQTNESYQYILTDETGKILAVKNGSPVGGSVFFDQLAPGGKYRVYEAERSATVKVGNDVATVTGGAVSTPTELPTPVIEQNYKIENDKKDEGKTVLVISPADPDTDYAILDKNGNVVMTGDSDTEGWKTPKGTPAKVEFTGLDSNEEYTVVAKPKKVTGVSPESKKDEGAPIVSDPNGTIQVPKFIVETINGTITKVGNTELNTNRYEEARSKDQVTVLAQATNAAGNPFLYWKVTVGDIEGLENVIKTKEVTFTMPKSNVVLTAYYDRPSSGNATVTDDSRGGNNEFVLNPLDVETLESLLTTVEDKILIQTNGADVTYKVTYKKGLVKATESNAVKLTEQGSEYEDHSSAFTSAWSLDVDMERYVNGRKVGTASASNAEFTTYVRLNQDDVEMLDYRVYRVSTDPDDNSTILEPVSLDYAPEETGGLFTFTTKVGERYILVYSKAFRVYFQNILETENFLYYFHVRKGEAPSDSYYDEKYQTFLDYDNSIPEILVDKNGMEYKFGGWSYLADRLSAYDEGKAITRETHVYAYYKDNKGELDQARNTLDEAILAALKMSDDYFLKSYESAQVKAAIADALKVFEKTNPKATAEELQAALDHLRDLCKPFEELLEKRYEHYDNIKDSGSSGGHGGGGGSGSGTKNDPFGPAASKSYIVGTNGHWQQIDGAPGKWKFVLNGGIELKSQWAKLNYTGLEAVNSGWYHFDSNGVMSTGWFKDESGRWYYSRPDQGSQYGLMMTGWLMDPTDKQWYYLNPATGAMATGWRNIDGKWYYFSSQTNVRADGSEITPGQGTTGRPAGVMLTGTTTPDGYTVGADGVWQE